MRNYINGAERIDLMNSRIAIGLLMASFIYGLDALGYILIDDYNQILKWISFSTGMLAVIWILWAVVPSLLHKLKSRKFNHKKPESFITETFHKAIIKSWALTMAGLMLLKLLDKMVVQLDFPLNFYLDSLIFIMLFSASITFLIMTHIGDDEGHEEGFV